VLAAAATVHYQISSSQACVAMMMLMPLSFSPVPLSP
jgi:hypothetical protein